MLEHFGVARRAVPRERRRLDRPAAPPPRHPRRARARGDGARAARALRSRRSCASSPTRTPRCRSRTARRSRSRTWSRSSARRSRSRATSACSTSAPARATRRRCSPSSPPRCTRSSGSRSSPKRPAPRSRRPATSASQVHVGDGTLGLPEHAPFDGDRGRGRGRRGLPPALWEQLARGRPDRAAAGVRAPRPAALRPRADAGRPAAARLASRRGSSRSSPETAANRRSRCCRECAAASLEQYVAVLENRAVQALGAPPTGSSSRSSASSARPATSSTSWSTALLGIGAALGRRDVSFVVAAANNYWWNRHWTFARRRRATSRYQGMRFFVVSLAAFCVEPALAVRVPRLARAGQDRLAGGRDRPRHAAELPREQALVVPPLRLASPRWRSLRRARCRPRRRSRTPRTARTQRAADARDQATKLFLAHAKVAAWLDALPAEAGRPTRRSRAARGR